MKYLTFGKTQKYSFSKFLLRHDVVRVFVSVSVLVFCTDYFVIVPLNVKFLHSLQHSLYEHQFNLYSNQPTIFAADLNNSVVYFIENSFAFSGLSFHLYINT